MTGQSSRLSGVLIAGLLVLVVCAVAFDVFGMRAIGTVALLLGLTALSER